LKELPFDPYDFFGYIASGLVLVVLGQLTIGFPRVFGADLKPFDMAVTVALLKDAAFRQCLAKTTIFIASHHGRQNGYCEQVFDYCKPHVIVLSDKNLMHESQEHDYAKHATGIPWSNAQTRFVLTTRCDGHIKIEKDVLGPAYITTGFSL
jgi:hypothetical protein